MVILGHSIKEFMVTVSKSCQVAISRLYTIVKLLFSVGEMLTYCDTLDRSVITGYITQVSGQYTIQLISHVFKQYY